jgi:hypothetical protein
MKIIFVLISLIPLFFVLNCTGLKSTQMTPIVHYIPVKFEVTYAKEVNVSDKLRLLINKKFQEYIDDKGWFYKNSTPIDLSITITNIEIASTAATVFVGFLAPPGKISGEVVILINGKIAGSYKIDADYRAGSGLATFGDLNDRLAGKFAALVMEAVRQ